MLSHRMSSVSVYRHITDADSGAIDTRMVNPKDAENITWPIKRIGTPLEAAQLIAFLLSDDAAFITGSVYTIDGGLTC